MGYYKKKLLVVLLVFLFILFFVNSLSINSYALTDVLNAETVIIDDYEQNEVSFIAWAYDYLENNGGVDNDNDSNIVALTEFMQEIRAGRYVYYQRYANTGRIICWCYDGRSNNTWQSGTYVTWSGNTSLTTDGIYLTGMSWYDLTFNNGTPSFVHQFTNDPAGYFIPQCVFTKKDLVTVNFVAKYIPASYGEGDNLSVNATVVGWANLITALDDISTTNKATKNEIKKLNDFMNNQNVDNSSYDMPTQNSTSDVSSGGFNNIFTQLYNAIDNWDTNGIVFPIPWSNGQNIVVPSDLTENIVANWVVLKPLFSLVWYFLVSLFIVKDVQKYVDNMKSGEILTKSDTNIKSDML